MLKFNLENETVCLCVTAEFGRSNQAMLMLIHVSSLECRQQLLLFCSFHICMKCCIKKKGMLKFNLENETVCLCVTAEFGRSNQAMLMLIPVSSSEFRQEFLLLCIFHICMKCSIKKKGMLKLSLENVSLRHTRVWSISNQAMLMLISVSSLVPRQHLRNTIHPPGPHF